jgi:hypothetical protein
MPGCERPPPKRESRPGQGGNPNSSKNGPAAYSGSATKEIAPAVAAQARGRTTLPAAEAAMTGADRPGGLYASNFKKIGKNR